MAERRILPLFCDKIAKRHKSAIIRSRYILECGREHETSSMRPYVNLSFRNDNHIAVNPSLSNFKCSIQGQNKVKLGQVPPNCTENMGRGTNSFFFENWNTGTSYLKFSIFLLPEHILLGKIIEGRLVPLPTGSYTHALCKHIFFNKILWQRVFKNDLVFCKGRWNVFRNRELIVLIRHLCDSIIK